MGLCLRLLVTTKRMGRKSLSTVGVFTGRHPATDLTFLQLPCVHCSTVRQISSELMDTEDRPRPSHRGKSPRKKESKQLKNMLIGFVDEAEKTGMDARLHHYFTIAPAMGLIM